MGSFAYLLYLLAGYILAGVIFWLLVEHYRRDFGTPLEISDAILVVLVWPLGVLFVLRTWISRLRKT